ncbi:Six-hairpin glycosidase-like protein [Stenotrophomonas rhizophila]|uniref:Six-hairpin glycosidase-like protein n=1 Tax=Stenotrophomonas rhizophila TaxID=216778 RepID=UPI001E5A6F03|nr:Six-hairpin glycosidase-like protein [Stenotrophomonas rhizophila]MCC7634588.1 Six-hairpin glycosidase-like protein [Stenotrophomonas rhizophila]MCC7664143.1 Six-hairpin glycosidase-like protein [Stenotrophomonas rhizophila]
MLKMICLTAAFGLALGSTATAADLTFDGRTARAEPAADGGFVLHTPQGEVHVAAAPMRSQTGSMMFDSLFALAQQELDADRVDAIRDPAFNQGRPVPCNCFQTGERWPYVWTRDVSFAADLALARLDPVRTRQSLQFKLSTARGGHTPGLFVAQDTGSGGSWPISSDRVVWFLAARALLDDPAFAGQTWQALQATLAQDRAAVFDPRIGLYRGETSFLDWREQTYPDWTAKDVRFIGDSFALSTNVLHYQALRLAERLARERGDARVADYAGWADALAVQIDARFWREDAGLYMSYIGEAAHPVPYAKYDLLAISLGVLADVFPADRARRALANYPAVEGGSPVVWPQQAQQPIYHNRAVWPFVSAYSLRAARRLDDAARIQLEIQSLMRGTALAGSNMENYEMRRLAVHVDEGALSGPVVNSPRQLWSVAGYLSMVLEGVFGVEADGSVAPKLPTALVPQLFGKRSSIELDDGKTRYVLKLPRKLDGQLLVAGRTTRRGNTVTVQLVAAPAPGSAEPRSVASASAAAYAPATPTAPNPVKRGRAWSIPFPANHVLWLDGRAVTSASPLTLSDDGHQHCLSLTRRDGPLESLHSPTTCVGLQQRLAGARQWSWTAAAPTRVRIRLRYANPNGPINTGVTAAVKQLVAQCPGQPAQRATVVMPHSVGPRDSTAAEFELPKGRCRFTLEQGFNMSALTHFAQYNGGKGGRDGVLNQAQVSALLIAPIAPAAGDAR